MNERLFDSSLSRLNFIAIALLIFGAANTPIGAQSNDEPTTRNADSPVDIERAQREARAEALLLEIDQRIHYPRTAGLRDLRFRWHATGNGIFESVDFWIEYAWKAPNKERLAVLDAEGKLLTDLPPALKDRPEEVRFLLRQVVAMANTVVIGLPYAMVYKDYYKDVTEREINNKIETTITLVPKKKKLNAKITIKIKDGLPVEVVKTSEAGHENHMRYRFEKRGEKHIVTGFTSEVGNTVMQEEEYHYLTKEGILILSGLTRFNRQPEQSKQEVVLENLEVNIGLEDQYFEIKQAGLEEKK